ncbi:Uncharacterized protein SCF082_LOCUS1452 [Durusdinium trenchii]|uniref:Uncharacterized protein n=1 Tax=Durusdinium trenchii TaxID=1381693 RepID=A0ABP0HEY5_9DINO
MICEFMRLVFSCAKGMSDVLAKQPTSRSPRYSRLVRTEEEADLESPSVQAKEPDRICSILFPLIVYHVTCAGIVALAMFKGWLSIDGGGLPLELWVLWQQLCLWNLFLQNLVRCVMLDSGALKASTCTTVLAYTAPFASEMADTMKDWVVTGICILHAKTWIGFAVGTAVVGIEALARIRSWVRDRSGHFSYSFILLQALYAVILVTRLHLWVFIPGAILFATITGGSAAGVICCIIPICYILITDHLHQIDSLCVSFSEEAFRWCADGGLLAVVSIFVIIHSHIQVNQIEDTARDLRKTYRAILELPLKPTNPDGETCCEWMERRVTNLCVDFLSSARLLIAWSEDIPQGVIGVALVLRYAGPNGIGFAGISAIISISKGILIPGLQRAVLSHRTAAVQRGLDAIVREEKKRAMIEKRFQGTTPVGDSRVRFLVEGLLREESSDLLKRLNVGESDLFQAIRNRRESWLQESCEEIRNLVVADYLKQGVSAKDLFDLGHMTGNCKESGFSARECKDIAGFSVQQCRVAGFTPADCLEAGFSTNDCKDEGFSAAECKEAGFSPKQCKGAGFSAKECKEADFSAKEFKDAGFPAIQCRVVGFEVKVCQEAGYPTEELSREPTAQDYKDAGLSAEECKEVANFSAKECMELGFSLSEIGNAGFSHEELIDAGFSARQFKDDGASLSWLRNHGFSSKECKEAGFSAWQCKDASFDSLSSVSEESRLSFDSFDNNAGFSAKAPFEYPFAKGTLSLG